MIRSTCQAPARNIQLLFLEKLIALYSCSWIVSQNENIKFAHFFYSVLVVSIVSLAY